MIGKKPDRAVFRMTRVGRVLEIVAIAELSRNTKNEEAKRLVKSDSMNEENSTQSVLRKIDCTCVVT